jgi:hypothetical protein
MEARSGTSGGQIMNGSAIDTRQLAEDLIRRVAPLGKGRDFAITLRSFQLAQLFDRIIRDGIQIGRALADPRHAGVSCEVTGLDREPGISIRVVRQSGPPVPNA